jgi:holo-[acyl-carrier protein] synthase
LGDIVEIYGMGTQIIECLRVSELIHRHGERFVCRVFTPREIAVCRDHLHMTECYTAIWAAKQAVARSLHRESYRWDWTEIEILPKLPTATLRGATQALASEHHVQRVMVSMAYTRQVATATALALLS